MINELDSVDWSSMSHAYGPADDVPVWLRDMTSGGPELRDKALSHFYSAAHHQGDVYPCTVASLPFLFHMAQDAATPDRASIIELLVSIGRESMDRDVDAVYISPDGTESTAHADSVALMRESTDLFVRYAADPEPSVRRAAIEGLGLFLDDGDRAVGILRGRLPAESGIVERLLVVRTMADLALRLPAAQAAAMAWLDTLADDPTLSPDIPLAALVHRARCAPQDMGSDAVPTAIALLRRLTAPPENVPGDEARRSDSAECACTTAAEPPPAQNVPPHVAAAFEDLERHNRIHAPTTSLLRTFHAVLDSRVPERTTLLTAQLRSPDPATRYDAIRMAQDLILAWRGEHRELVTALAQCLLPDDPYTAAAAAESLGTLAPVAEPAREALASYVAEHRAAHGPDVWATPKPLLRRAHQEAVLALARLGDPRALPGLLTALDGDVDAWRAVQVAGCMRPAAGELVPRLTGRLANVDFSQPWAGTGVGALVSALAEQGDPAAVPAITDAVTAAVRHEEWRIAASTLDALASFGVAAASALKVVRPLADAQDVDLRMAATAALWELEADPENVVPRLHDLLDTYRRHEAADVLGRIGPPAATVLPRLRQMLTANYEWTRVHAAAALWDIGGDAENPAVVQTLLGAWENNDATSNHVLACLNRMGHAAAPALPRIRTELTLTRRSGRFRSTANDEDLQDTCRAIVARLA
ncbi:HEAT repeat domain-containing protein [Streptomyces adustus]|uniref:HEAT repeat domain-containing protein n=1 Tax=Streptomyces adustus TaxID=1609272 RepID=A0A5N8VAI5_9ACTN|nr:HEAT repeat domain-containing protein [Streptomyces adustus]MPY32270.1 HEAT repeat domain-containing protein [Streptomyces adustus]